MHMILLLLLCYSEALGCVNTDSCITNKQEATLTAFTGTVLVVVLVLTRKRTDVLQVKKPSRAMVVASLPSSLILLRERWVCPAESLT